MDPYGKSELLGFYDRHLRKFGDTPQAVRWTPRGQLRRFEALLEVAGDLKGKEVLDFGCGKGDLCGFMRERGAGARYSGLDVNGNLVALARRKFPGVPFHVLDIETDPFGIPFDVVLVCGVFNLRIAGIAESMRGALRRLFPLCREALHLNVPSTRCACKDLEMYYVDPDELLGFARDELTPEAVLREDLVESEIFLSLYRRPPGPSPGAVDGAF